MHKKFQRTITLGLLCSISVLLTACVPQDLKEKALNLIKRGEAEKTREAAQTIETVEEESPFAPSESKESGGNLSALLGQKKNLKCTFEQVTPMGETSSTLYTNGTDILIQSTIAEETNIEANVLLKGKQYYVWNRPENKGIKMVIEETATTNPQETQEPLESLEDVEFYCENWKLDAAIFEVPADVEFFEPQPQGMLNPSALPPESLEMPTTE